MSSPVVVMRQRSPRCARPARRGRAAAPARRSVRATAAAHGSALPGGTGRPGSYSTDSASSTSRQSRRPASSTSTPVSVRSAGQALPSSSAPRCTSGRIRPRTTATPRTAGSRDGTGKAGAGVEHLDHLVRAAGRPAGRRRAPAGARAHGRSSRRHPAELLGRRAPRSGRSAARGRRRRPAPPRSACRRSWRSPDPGRCRRRPRRGSRAAPPRRPGPGRSAPRRRRAARRCWATLRNSGSAAGRTPQTAGSWSSSSRRPSGPAATRI